jgi:hypothetical protein
MPITRAPLVNIGGVLSELPKTEVLQGFPMEGTNVMTGANGAGVAIKKGMAANVDSAGKLRLSNASDANAYNVLGLASSDIAVDGMGSIMLEGIMEKADWTDVAGTTALTPGAFYFLSATTAGMISTDQPDTGYSVRLGVALGTTKLKLTLPPQVIKLAE